MPLKEAFSLISHKNNTILFEDVREWLWK